MSEQSACRAVTADIVVAGSNENHFFQQLHNSPATQSITAAVPLNIRRSIRAMASKGMQLSLALLSFCFVAVSAFPQTTVSHGPIGQLMCRTCGPNPDPTPFPTPRPTSETGFMHPKFVVVGLTYAPPGARSSVSYANSTMLGTSSSLDQSLANNASLSASVNAGLTILGQSVDTTGSASSAFGQEADTSSSVAINNTVSHATSVPGPASSATGIDHDYDIVWVWLNPLIDISITPPSTVRWTGYGYDLRDPAPGMDVVPLYVTWLKNPSTIRADVASRCARSWDTTGLGGLTSADYATILARDPFSSGSYDPNADPNHRFDPAYGSTFTYEAPPAGGQPFTETLSLISQTTSTAGTATKDTFSVGVSLEMKTGVNFVADMKVDLKASDTLTWTNKWSTTTNKTVGQTATLSLTGPAFSDNYTGPTQIEVWKDNVYGGFMFYPVQ